MNNKELVNRQREYFLSGKTLPVSERVNNLKKLRRAILDFEGKILQALYEDLGKSEFEAYATEIGVTLHELSYMIRKLPSLAKPRR